MKEQKPSPEIEIKGPWVAQIESYSMYPEIERSRHLSEFEEQDDEFRQMMIDKSNHWYNSLMYKSPRYENVGH